MIYMEPGNSDPFNYPLPQYYMGRTFGFPATGNLGTWDSALMVSPSTCGTKTTDVSRFYRSGVVHSISNAEIR
jgi:hypothetical protein